MDPVQDQVLADQEDHHLRGQRKRGERTVAIIVEVDQAVRGGDAEQERGADDKQADAQKAREDRDEEPVAKVGDQIALAPPRAARIAGPEVVSTVKTAPRASEIGRSLSASRRR